MLIYLGGQYPQRTLVLQLSPRPPVTPRTQRGRLVRSAGWGPSSRRVDIYLYCVMFYNLYIKCLVDCTPCFLKKFIRERKSSCYLLWGLLLVKWKLCLPCKPSNHSFPVTHSPAPSVAPSAGPAPLERTCMSVCPVYLLGSLLPVLYVHDPSGFVYKESWLTKRHCNWLRPEVQGRQLWGNSCFSSLVATETVARLRWWRPETSNNQYL